MISKIIQNKIFDIVFNIQDKLGISDSNLFIFTFIIHHVIILFPFILGVYYNSFLIIATVVIIEIIFIAQYILFKGCIITRIEQKIEKNNINVADGLLEFLGIKIEYKNRVYLSILCFISTIILAVYKLLVPSNMLHFYTENRLYLGYFLTLSGIMLFVYKLLISK